MPRPASPRFSVVVPAHNEETVVRRCLEFVRDLQPGEAEVVVVANGCLDRTAEVARSVPGVQVVELPRGGKAEALNAGDGAATTFPRIYLDADVRLDVRAVRRLAEATAGSAPVVAAPRVSFRTEGRPWSVRGFYETYGRLPYVSEGLVGLGVYALSEDGRRRFGPFPELTADDLFVQRLFRPVERVVLDDVTFEVEVPRTLRQLVAVRTRTAFGNRQLAETQRDTGFAASTSSTSRALLGLVRRHPGLWPSAAIYVGVTLEARRRSRGRRGAIWHQDRSTRTPAATSRREEPAGALRTAYLVSQYPALSHEFVAREIRSLRARGVGVSTFSVRPPDAGQLRTEADRSEAQATTILLASKTQLTRAFVMLLGTSPRTWLAGLGTALRSGPRSGRGRLWQLFYFVEAALLAESMSRAQLRHVHVHFANNSADIARIAVTIGERIDGRPWSWSLAMHGPTEFADVEGFDLAAKVRSAAFVACISDHCRSRLMALVEPPQWPKLRLVRMSVDAQRYPSMIKMREARPPGPLRVLFVGRLVPEKGADVLLEAVRGLRDAVQVRIVGDGPVAEHLTELLRTLRLERCVTLVGPLGQDELPEQYGWADAFCLPSFAEGLPVVLMEAMSTGLPVVTTRIAGVPELVEDGVSGIVVPPGRADRVAQALLRLAGDPRLRSQLGRAAVEAVRLRHSPDANGAALAELLTTVPGTSPAAPVGGERPSASASAEPIAALHRR